jgi:hypothetical protein
VSRVFFLVAIRLDQAGFVREAVEALHAKQRQTRVLIEVEHQTYFTTKRHGGTEKKLFISSLPASTRAEELETENHELTTGCRRKLLFMQ